MGKARRNKAIRRMVRDAMRPGVPVSQLVLDRNRPPPADKPWQQVPAAQAKGTFRYNTKKMKRLARTNPEIAAQVKATADYHKMLRAEKDGGAATFEDLFPKSNPRR